MNNCAFTALQEVLNAARSCRAAQRGYFATRTNANLTRARYWEDKLDKEIKQADYALLHGCSMPVQSEFPF